VTRTNPGASTGTAVAEPVVASAAAADFGAQFGARFETEAPALVTAVARPQFAEMSEEPSYTPLPRDYASDFSNGALGAAETADNQPSSTPGLFPEADEDSQRDLDTPSFLRRLRF